MHLLVIGIEFYPVSVIKKKGKKSCNAVKNVSELVIESHTVAALLYSYEAPTVSCGDKKEKHIVDCIWVFKKRKISDTSLLI